jgi:hypothetical protein
MHKMREFPHVVEIPSPVDGFSDRLDAMHAWYGARGLQVYRGSSGDNVARWCFADAATADAFAAEFRGTRI